MAIRTYPGNRYTKYMGHWRTRKTWLALIASLFGLFASSWLASSRALAPGERGLLELIYDLPEELRLFFLTVTLLGSAWILAIVLLVLLIKARLDVALRVMLSGISAYVAVGLAKEFIGRPRPGDLFDILQREIFVFGQGFPSAHTALATAIALILAAYMPQGKKWIVWVWIGLVALSRLYLGVHAPLDVIGGFCIGVLSAICVMTALPKGRSISGFMLAKKRL